MVCSHFMCPVLRYPLIAKTIGSTVQNRVTRMSPCEELGWLLPWHQWERDQIFRASVTFFWVLLAFDTEHRNAGTSTKSSITDLLCLAKKPSVGISPVVPKVTKMDTMHSGWAKEQHAGESQKVLTPHLTCDFTCEVSREKLLCSSEIQPSFSSTRLSKADYVERRVQ